MTTKTTTPVKQKAAAVAAVTGKPAPKAKTAAKPKTPAPDPWGIPIGVAVKHDGKRVGVVKTRHTRPKDQARMLWIELPKPVTLKGRKVRHVSLPAKECTAIAE